MFIILLSFNMALKKKKNLTDEELVAQIITSKNSSLVEIIYERYADKIYRKCYSFVKDNATAEDLTHDIFIKVYMNLSSFKQRSKFSTWLYSITYNFCIDYLRKKKKEQIVYIEDQKELVGDMEVENASDLQHIAAGRLVKLLERVKAEDKMILLMKYKDNMSIKDIQRIFDISESAVKMRIKRAKAKVKTLYQEIYVKNNL